MSELDDLRRIAYGRTGSIAEEVAAADARAALARHEAAGRAAHEADEFARARASDPAAEPEPEQQPAPAEAEAPDEPGYLRRLSATWRLWALPALVAFVVGVAVTVASGMVILQASRTSPAPETNTSQRFLDDSQLITPGMAEEGTLAIESGDLEAATAVLNRPREASDFILELDDSIVPDSTRLLEALDASAAYAAMSKDGEICLIVISGPINTDTACAPPSGFAGQGLSIARGTSAQSVRVHWDGVDVVETVTAQ